MSDETDNDEQWNRYFFIGSHAPKILYAFCACPTEDLFDNRSEAIDTAIQTADELYDKLRERRPE